MTLDGRRQRTLFVRDRNGRFGTTLPLDARCPRGLGNRTGYHRGCRCPLCTAAATAYFRQRRISRRWRP